MSKLTSKEINLLLAKIRREYEHGWETTRSGLYNLEAFNDRYKSALLDRHDLSIFLMDEVKVLDEIKSKILAYEEALQKVRERKENDNLFSLKVDGMIDDFHNSITKYPTRELHKNADDEIVHLYGAFEELYNCFNVIKLFVTSNGTDYSIETIFKDIDYRFEAFVFESVPNKCAQIYIDYVISLETGVLTTRSEQYILKESGLFLHFFVDKLELIRETALKVGISSEVILPNLLETKSERVYKIFSGKPLVYIYDSTIEYANSIISDFRLWNFKKNV